METNAVTAALEPPEASEAPEVPLAWPAGHYYSPIPDPSAIRQAAARVFAEPPAELPGIDLNDAGQRDLFDALCRHHDAGFFPYDPVDGRRYHFRNDYFQQGEALIYAALLRHFRPRRVIEVGSGYSSCVALDIRDAMDAPFDCLFIEPYPEDRLLGLLRPEDHGSVVVDARPVQEVPTSTFSALESGDFLFIDSTHVLKTDSDVTHHLFRILPALAPGVVVHLHDIFYPFEYPEGWVYGGRAWNELYAVRAFLQYNAAFEIAFFNSYFFARHRDRAEAAMPRALESPGSSLWLRRR